MNPAAGLVAIVDDEDAVRRALERLLRSAGMASASFASGLEFLKSLDHGCPDCVVLDLHMPGLSGFDVQARLCEAGLKIPVIAITGHDSAENRERVRALGAAAYLRKPVAASTLLEAIASATARRAEANASRNGSKEER